MLYVEYLTFRNKKAKVMFYMVSRIDNKINLLEKSLDYLWLRNEIISNNIANVNTPGYKKYDISFNDYLNNERSKISIGSMVKDSKFLPIGRDRKQMVAPQVWRENNISMRRDGNSVDIDVENAELAKNSVNYNVIANQLSKELSLIKQAINEGRK